MQKEEFTKILNHRIADNFSAKWFDSRNNRYDLVDIGQQYFYYYAHPMPTMFVDFSAAFLSMSMSAMWLMTMLGCQFDQSFASLELCWYFLVTILNRLLRLMLNRLKVMLEFGCSTKVIRSRIVVQCQFSIGFVVVPNHIRYVDDVMYHRRLILMDLVMDS